MLSARGFTELASINTPKRSRKRLRPFEADPAPTSAASSSTTKTPNQAICSAKSSDFSPARTVTLLVGPNEQEMIAYGSQLTRDSEFFTAAMKKEWAEGQTRTIKLPEEKPDVMAHYLSYLYSGKLFTEDIKSVSGKAVIPCFELLASLYVSCEQYLNKLLQSAILTEIFRLAVISGKNGKHWIPTAESVAIIYRGTPEGSPCRRLMVDLHVAVGDLEWMSYDTSGSFGTGFCVDVIRSMNDRLQKHYLQVEDLNLKDYL